jgi:hypothetical protein
MRDLAAQFLTLAQKQRATVPLDLKEAKALLEQLKA